MNRACGIDIYLLAGIKTWPGFFEPLMSRLAELCREEEWRDSTVRIVYPYGDYRRGLLRQVREVKPACGRGGPFYIAGRLRCRRLIPRLKCGCSVQADTAQRGPPSWARRSRSRISSMETVAAAVEKKRLSPAKGFHGFC
ncbi:hypothetical protein CH50_00245 [Paenibacillus darwinianus]|nr:hypothetical protein CH50_00245 [Paenibacillus darwinianus]